MVLVLDHPSPVSAQENAVSRPARTLCPDRGRRRAVHGSLRGSPTPGPVETRYEKGLGKCMTSGAMT